METRAIKNVLSKGLPLKALTTFVFSICAVPAFADEAPSGEALSQAVVQACPSFWEDSNAEIDLAKRTGDYWEDDAEGRQDFADYLTTAMADNPISESALNLMVDDRLTIATECATARVMLMQFQMEAMPNDILIAMNAVGNGVGEAIGEAVGFSPQNPAKSCKDIKERYDDVVDGAYWINVSSNNPVDSMEVFCDMTTDGGGWTLAAYLAQDGRTIPDGFWVQPVATEKYDLGRAPVSGDYSLGVMDEIDDTEMIVVANTPDIASASELGGFIQFKYQVANPTFNNALIPHLESVFDFRRELGGEYQQGKLTQRYPNHYWMVLNASSQGAFYIALTAGNAGYFYGPRAAHAKQLWFYIR